MIAVHLTRAFRVHGCDDLDAHTDEVMEQLLALESDSVRDSDVSASAIEEIVEISVYAVAATFDEAAGIADSAIRTAIHAAKGHTPDWQTIQTLAERADLVEA